MGRRRRRIDRGRWQVQRERCRLEDHRPPAPRQAAQAVSDVLPGLLKRLGMEQQHWLRVLRDEWPVLVGEDVGRHSRPGRLEGRALTVFVDSAVWLSEIKRFGHGQMLGNLQKRFGAERIASLRLAPDPDG